ncbi:hypothetical protein GCK72_011947 [Caenorhabditis remanei]|uniref:Uncharacterized protein n=1 Tax=Caenorhabditis remanei TaxID=31234 RepID=A0A6A5GJL9_CAERE|nr:hypothetical protein GCK72_011947 [Caenorhabditis remanei]KAF1755497.1 hypothetical protein GCK72_011947 [Caenorhabditis remanei]
MPAELEIVKNVDFEMLGCKYLIMDKRKNLHRLNNYVQVPELTEMQLNDVLLQYKDDKDYVIEHLYISEMKDIEQFIDKLLRFRKIYSLTVCQITIRLPKTVTEETLWKFTEDILRDENYILLNVSRMDNYTEFYFFANNEYQCMMRYV